MADVMPLDDVTVIDLTQDEAGPFATRLLGDYGANVIKIEPPEGDPARMQPPFHQDVPGPERSAVFLFLNTNKRSVVLDLERPEDRERLLGLVAGADAVVESFPPGTMERLGLGYEALREVNPRIVLTSMTNFGQDGPYRDYHVTDLTLYAMGGPMIASGDVDHEPLKNAGHMTLYHAGIVGALATSLALRAAEAARRGRARRPLAPRDGHALDRPAAGAADDVPVHGQLRHAPAAGLGGGERDVPVRRRLLHAERRAGAPRRRHPHDRPARAAGAAGVGDH